LGVGIIVRVKRIKTKEELKFLLKMTKICSKIYLLFLNTKVHYRVKDSPPLAGLLLKPFNCRKHLL